MIGGRYQLRAAIGNGGMGTVWQAVDTLLRRDVAVKEVLLPPGMATAERTAMYERTLREARACAALSHPSVVQVYDVVTEAGRPWIVMELLHARSLAEIIINDGPVAPRAVAKIGIALLGALEVAHSAGVLHRDVKPANVLICNDGRCVLTDFGVARLPAESNLTTPGMVLGSPHFISPERAVGGAFGPPSDLFSLGVSLFTAVEGRPPFDKGDPFDTMRAVVEEPPVRAVRAGPLGPVLAGLLEKDPAVRWDVPRGRAALRDLLAGPLANTVAQRHHVTDPYSVLPQPPPPSPIYQSNPQPSGQIGGRAMLAPGELPGDRTGRSRSASPATEVFGSTPPRRGGAHGKAGGGFGDVVAGLQAQGHKLFTRFRALPKQAQWGIAGGTAVVLVLALAGAAGAFGGGPTPAATTPTTAAASPTGPAFQTQGYTDSRKFTVNVPASWTRSPSSSYVDFIDPDDHGRWLRINVEKSGNSALKFLQSAETQLSTHPDKCAAPFKEIRLIDTVTLAGRAAAELEYTCGTGDKARHGLWIATIVDNSKAYEFYLSVEESRFAESKPVFDEALRTYQLTA
jgi:serine/threonine protein kinase